MKTLNYNENLRSGNTDININYYDGGTINVNASLKEGERSTSVALEYDSISGSRRTEVKDYSLPFDNVFYAEMDAKVLKVVSAISREE